MADASHELRTPISSLRANIQVLQDADLLPEEERASLRADIIAELDELTALVGDVVELARGAKPSDVVDDVRIDQIVRQLVERAERRCGRRRSSSARACSRPSSAASPSASAARSRTCSGTRTSGARRAARSRSTLVDGTLTIRDHGPGFDEVDLPHVFDRFYRADSARGMPGSGLGLAIVRQAAEAHGGSATVANAAGGGALVTITFGPSVIVSDEDSASDVVSVPLFEQEHEPRASAQPGAECIADAPDAHAALDLLHHAAFLEHDDRGQVLDVEVLGELRRPIDVDATAREDAVVLALLQHLVKKCLDTPAGAGLRRVEVAAIWVP